MPVFSVKWADSCVNAVLDSVLTHGAATSGDISRTAKMAHDDVASILASMREAGWVTLDDTEGGFGEEGGKWSLTQAGRQTYVKELQEHRDRVSELEQCVADGLRRWDLTLDYIDPLGELLPDLDGWEHYEWRTRAAAVLAGPGVEPAPPRKRERDVAVHGPAPVFVAEGGDPEPHPFYFTRLTIEGVEMKVTHGGQSPIWVNGVSIYQPNDGPLEPDPMLGDGIPADPPPEADGNHWTFDFGDDAMPWPPFSRLLTNGVIGFPRSFPDEDAPWVWPEERSWVRHGDADDRNVHRHVRLFGREVFAYSSTRSAPGWFRDVILSRLVRR